MNGNVSLYDAFLPITHVGLLCQWLAFKGYSHRQLLGDTRLAKDDLARSGTYISFKQHQQITLKALSLTGEPHLGLEFGAHLGSKAMGLVGLAASTSATFGDALQVITQYFNVVSPLFELDLEIYGDTVVITFSETVPYGDTRLFLYETFISAFHRFIPGLVENRVQPDAVRLTLAEPAEGFRISRSLGCAVYFEATYNKISFLNVDMTQKLTTSDPVTHLQAIECLQEYSVSNCGCQGLGGKIKNLLLHKNGVSLDINTVASELAMSPRTLSRKLKNMGTTYSSIVDEVRTMKASKLMRNNASDLREISAALGFKDVFNFRRAFKRWTGLSVTEYRRLNFN